MSGVVAIAGVGVFTPSYPNTQALRSGERASAAIEPKGELLDKRSRRRASLQTKAIADAYGEALAQSGLDASMVASVFGSAMGEAATMIGLLDQMWREGGMLSPMRFATSVHNAAAGVVSIATGNRGFSTSLGADHDTPAMALVEGMGIALAHDAPVVVACGDEATPEGLVAEGEGWGSLTVAMALVPLSQARPDMMRLSMPTIDAPDLVPDDVDGLMVRNPIVGLLDLASCILRGRQGRLRLDRGLGRGYCVDLSVDR